jgi:hypothetical protein
MNRSGRSDYAEMGSEGYFKMKEKAAQGNRNKNNATL